MQHEPLRRERHRNFCYGQSLGFLFTSSVVARRVLVLTSGWLASYVGQSEVPALITSLCYHLTRESVLVLSAA